MLIEIKTINGNLLYSSSKHDNIKDVVEEAVANQVSLCLANLEGVDLSNANLQYARLESANLKNANLERTDLEMADMYGTNLSYANLRNTNLWSATLRTADLRVANLWGTNLSYADLSYADLSYADLGYADLSRADLKGANLEGTNLSEIQLAEAHVDRLSGINYAVCSFRGHGECGRQLLAVEINSEVMLFCGCFSGNEEELRDYIESGDENYKESRLLALETVLKLINFKRK